MDFLKKRGFIFAYNSFITYIKVILSKYLKPNRWPKSGLLALNGVLLVAQKWPVGKQEVNCHPKNRISEMAKWSKALNECVYIILHT